MKKSLKKAAAFFLTAAMAVSLAGCGGSGEKSTIQGSSEGFPETVSVFTHKSGSLYGDMKDYNEVYSFQLLEEATGTHVNWIIPPSSGYEEKFNLMIASGELPDVIFTQWDQKGVKQYIEDEVLVDLSPYVAEYMPNFTAFCKANPEIAREFVYDGGKIYTIPMVRENTKLCIYTGPIIRTDWLEKLNLKTPTNAEELYNVLKAFKTQDPNGNGQADEIPMSTVGSKGGLGLNALLFMFGTTNGFYVEDGKVKYGIMEKGNFDEGLAYIAKLYKEGLIDPDYILQDRTALLGKITNNKVGFSFEYQPTQIMTTMAENDPSFKFEGIPWFTDKNGQKRSIDGAYTQVTPGGSAGITTACKDPFAVMRWIDYMWSEEGHMIINFGKEGDTYTMVDNVPTFVDKIQNNTEGLTRSQVWGKNFGSYNGYFSIKQDWNSYSQYLSKDGKAAIETWADGVVTDKNLPRLMFEEADKETLASVYTPIETYVAEQIDKIILGQVSVSELDNIRAEITKRGINDVLAIYQKTYDAYEKKDIELK